MRTDVIRRFLDDPRARRAGLTTVATGLSMLSKLVCGMLVMHLVNHYAGAEAFGLIVTVAGVAMWLLAFDLGLAPAVKNRLIPLIARDPASTELAQVIAQALFASLVLVALGISVLLVAMPMLPFERFFGHMDEPTKRWFPLFFTVSCASVLLALPGIIARAIASSFQQEYRLWASTIAGPVLGLLATWCAIRADLGLAQVGAAALVGQALGSWLTLMQVVRHRPALFRWSARAWNVSGLLREGLPFMIVQCAAAIIFQSGIFIVNLLHGAIAAGAFSVHAQIFGYAAALTGIVVQPYWSAFGDARSRGECSWLRQTLMRLAVSLTVGAVVLVAAICAAGAWLVPALSAGNYQWDAHLALALGLNIILVSCGNVFSIFLASARIVTGPAYLIVGQALAVVLLGILLGSAWGPVGVVWGAVIAYLVTSAWYAPYKTLQLLRDTR